MGNTHINKVYPYNKIEDINNSRGDGYVGPFIHTNITDFQKESIEHFQNKSLIG